jgi:hypothetical protein
MPSAADVLKGMPSIEEIAKQAAERAEQQMEVEAVEPTEESVEKVASDIVNYLCDNEDVRSQVLAGLSDRFAPHLKEAALRNEEIVSDEEIAKIASECEAAGRFIAQGFISMIEDYENAGGAE